MTGSNYFNSLAHVGTLISKEKKECGVACTVCLWLKLQSMQITIMVWKHLHWVQHIKSLTTELGLRVTCHLCQHVSILGIHQTPNFAPFQTKQKDLEANDCADDQSTVDRHFIDGWSTVDQSTIDSKLTINYWQLKHSWSAILYM